MTALVVGEALRARAAHFPRASTRIGLPGAPSQRPGPLAVPVRIDYGKGVAMFPWRHTPGQGASKEADHARPFGRQLDQARAGDKGALSALYRQFLPGVFGYIAARVPDRSTAEDLTSEVFLRMVEGIRQVRAQEETAFAAWILQIARVTVAGFYRKRKNQPALVPLTSEPWGGAAEAEGDLALLIPAPGGDPVHLTEVREEWGEVVEAINQLTEEQRQVLVSRLIMGYDYETVGRMMGKNANAIKALQFRALKSLHRLLGMKAASHQKSASRLPREKEPVSDTRPPEGDG